jgi:hypothetical protein
MVVKAPEALFLHVFNLDANFEIAVGGFGVTISWKDLYVRVTRRR